MDRNDILSLLKDRGIYYEITLHEAVFDMAGSALLDLPHPRCVAKNLFVHDEGRRNWYIYTFLPAPSLRLACSTTRPGASSCISTRTSVKARGSSVFTRMTTRPLFGSIGAT